MTKEDIIGAIQITKNAVNFKTYLINAKYNYTDIMNKLFL